MFHVNIKRKKKKKVLALLLLLPAACMPLFCILHARGWHSFSKLNIAL
jgi:hypothetical protein